MGITNKRLSRENTRSCIDDTFSQKCFWIWFFKRFEQRSETHNIAKLSVGYVITNDGRQSYMRGFNFVRLMVYTVNRYRYFSNNIKYARTKIVRSFKIIVVLKIKIITKYQLQKTINSTYVLNGNISKFSSYTFIYYGWNYLLIILTWIIYQ